MTEPKRVSANGIEFAYLEAGPPDGPFVLCLHGFPDLALTYEPLLADLADAGFRAVAPWLRGYAPTEVPADGVYHATQLALDAIAIADALAPDGDAYVVGHDWGAGAARLAVTYKPERFRKLVTLNVPPQEALSRFLSSPDQIKRSWYVWFFQMPGLPEMAVQADDYAFVDKLWADWSPGFTPPEAYMRAVKDTLSSPGSLEAAIGYYRQSFGGPVPDGETAKVAAAAGPVTVPSMYLHGADDGCLGADLIDEEPLRATFPGGLEFEIVPGVGHFLLMERPDVVNAKIVSFLRS